MSWRSSQRSWPLSAGACGPSQWCPHTTRWCSWSRCYQWCSCRSYWGSLVTCRISSASSGSTAAVVLSWPAGWCLESRWGHHWCRRPGIWSCSPSPPPAHGWSAANEFSFVMSTIISLVLSVLRVRWFYSHFSCHLTPICCFDTTNNKANDCGVVCKFQDGIQNRNKKYLIDPRGKLCLLQLLNARVET